MQFDVLILAKGRMTIDWSSEKMNGGVLNTLGVFLLIDFQSFLVLKRASEAGMDMSLPEENESLCSSRLS